MFKQFTNRLWRKTKLHVGPPGDFNESVLSLFQEFQVHLNDEIDSYEGQLGIVKHYSDKGVIASYEYLLKPLIVDRTLNFNKSTGVDLGCWLGLSTFMLSIDLTIPFLFEFLPSI